jgi:RNA polymerase sigma factor (sigma-70 family)
MLSTGMDAATDDARLVALARRGDTAAFSLLLTRHRPLLEGLCRRALRGDSLVEDAVQEASLHAFLGLDALKEPARFGPWLAGIGLNVCRRWLTRSDRERWSWEAAYGGRAGSEPPDEGSGPEEMAEAADVARQVRAAVSSLPAGQRGAIVAFYLSGLTYSETASQLGITVVATKGRLHKARAGLRPQLRSFWEEHFMSTPNDLIEMRVVDVRKSRDDHANHMVLLEDAEGGHRLPIFIGRPEAWALTFALEGIHLPRPLVYHFLLKSLEAVGAKLSEVRIEQLVERTYYAVAVYEGGGEPRDVDARPSDALNLAVLAGVPIRMRRAVWESGREENERIVATLEETFPHRGRAVLPDPVAPEAGDEGRHRPAAASADSADG